MEFKSLGELIKHIRLERGLSLHKLADEIGISAQNISAIENNRRKPSPRTLFKIIKFLKIQLSGAERFIGEYKYLFNKIGEINNLGNLLGIFRIKSDLSTYELGNMVGLSSTLIIKYEKNEIKPSLKNLMMICDTLNIPYKEIKRICWDGLKSRYDKKREYGIYCNGKLVDRREIIDYNVNIAKRRLELIIENEFKSKDGKLIKEGGEFPVLDKIKKINPSLGNYMLRRGFFWTIGNLYFDQRSELLKRFSQKIVKAYKKLKNREKKIFIGLAANSKGWKYGKCGIHLSGSFKSVYYMVQIDDIVDKFVLDYDKRKFGKDFKIPSYLFKKEGVISFIKQNLKRLKREFNKENYIPFILNLFDNEKKQKIEDIIYGMEGDIIYGRRLAREAAREFVSNYNDYKLIWDGEECCTYSLQNFLKRWDIKNKRFESKKSGSYHHLFNRFQFFCMKRRIKINEYFLNLLDKDLREQVEDIIYGMEGDIVYGRRLAREAAREFVSNYGGYKSSIRYSLYNFLKMWDVDNKKFKELKKYGDYINLYWRIKKFSEKRDISLNEYFLNLLDKDLREQVEDIIYGGRVIREEKTRFVEIAKEYVGVK